MSVIMRYALFMSISKASKIFCVSIHLTLVPSLPNKMNFYSHD